MESFVPQILRNLLIYYIFKELTKTQALILHGPSVIKKGEPLVLRCTSDVVPSGQSVEFAINHETYASLTRHSDGCYTALTKSKCDPSDCQCSENGKVYSLQIDSTPYKDVLNISCLMRFSFQPKTTDIKVTILDMKGPYISKNTSFPLEPGQTVNFECKIITTAKSTHLRWNCQHNHLLTHEDKNSTMHVSLLQVPIKRKLHGKNCTCIAEWGNFSSATDLVIEVNLSPTILLERRHVCNDSELQTITCSLDEYFSNYGFGDWRHVVNGYNVRGITGINNLNQSNLIVPCIFNYTGKYICSGWNTHRNITYVSNQSIEFEVHGPPKITDAVMIRSPNVVLCVKFLSVTVPKSVQWYQDGIDISNTTRMNITFSHENISYTLETKTIIAPGYVSNLKMHISVTGKFSTVIENDFGATRFDFLLPTAKGYSVKMSFQLQTILWILTGVVVLILSVVTTTALINRQAFRYFQKSSSNSITTWESRSIYFAAPMSEINEHTYSSTDPAYLSIFGYQSSRHYSVINDINKRTENDAADNESLHDYIEVL